MDPSIAPMVCIVTAILTTGGVLIFRPITKRLGALLEVMTQERLAARNAPPPELAQLAQVRDLLAGIDSRISHLEERQDFAEALLSTEEAPRALPVRPPPAN